MLSITHASSWIDGSIDRLQLIKAGGARANPTVFVIHHSFGDVNYDLDGFIVQNKHFYLQAAVLTAIESSAVSFIAHDSTQQGSDAGPPTAPSLPNGSTAKPNLLMTKTASLSNLLMTKSRDSLQKLLFTLTQHKMNYALCISTAPICKRVEKQAALFNKEHVVAQCRYYALPSRSIIITIITPISIHHHRHNYHHHYPIISPIIIKVLRAVQPYRLGAEGLPAHPAVPLVLRQVPSDAALPPPRCRPAHQRAERGGLFG